MKKCDHHKALDCPGPCPLADFHFNAALERWSLDISSTGCEMEGGPGGSNNPLEDKIIQKCEIGKLIPTLKEPFIRHFLRHGPQLLKRWQMREVCETIRIMYKYYKNPQSRKRLKIVQYGKKIRKSELYA